MGSSQISSSQGSYPQLDFAFSMKSIMKQASKQKLLPHILWSASKELNSRKVQDCQKSIRRQFDQAVKTPLKYDPEGAKNDRERIRQKVTQLVNNQLEVDYFENVRTRQGRLITFKGRKLETEPVQATNKQLEMFRNFNERRFRESQGSMFDDQLELKVEHMHTLLPQPASAISLTQRPRILTEPAQLPRPGAASTQKLGRTRQRFRGLQHQAKTLSARKVPVAYFNEKKTVGRALPSNLEERERVREIMRRVGGFDTGTGEKDLWVSRQEVAEWLKEHYQKPLRIVDFLELPQKLRFDDFWRVSRNLRVMPMSHVVVMAFLFFDHNNDGYICDYDLEKLTNLALVRPILAYDYQKMQQSRIKKKLITQAAYLELYKLGGVSQTAYFKWRLSNPQPNISRTADLQMKNRLNASKQKHIFLDLQSMERIYRQQHPFLWYDLLYLFAGITHSGLKYSP